MTTRILWIRGKGPVSLLAAAFFLFCLSGVSLSGRELCSAGEAATGERPLLRPDKVLPPETLFFYCCASWPKWKGAWKRSIPALILQEKEVQRFFKEPFQRLRKKIGFSPAGAGGGEVQAPTWVDNLLKAVPGPCLIAASSPPGGGEGAAMPTFVVVVGLGEGLAGQLRTVNSVLHGVASQLVKSDLGASLKAVATTEYSDTKLLSLKYGKYGLTTAIFGRLLIFTFGEDKNDVALCKTVIEGLANPANAGNLGASKDFRGMKLVGDRLESCWFNVAALHRRLFPDKGEVSTERLPVQVVKQVGFAWSVKKNGALTTTTALQGEGGPAAKILSGESLSEEALRLCPTGTTFVAAVRVQKGGLRALIKRMCRKVPRGKLARHYRLMSDRVKSPKIAAQLDKFFAALGEEVVLTSLPGAWPFGRGDMVLGVTLDNSEKAAAELKMLLELSAAKHEGARVVSSEYDGVTLSWLKKARGTSPVCAVAHGRFLLAGNVETMRRALKTLKGGPYFKPAPEFGKPGTGFIYVDWAALYHLKYEAVLKGLRWLDEFTGLLSRWGVDLNLMWPEEVVSRHLTPGILKIQRTKRGVLLVGNGPLPTPEVIGPPLGIFIEMCRAFFPAKRAVPAPVVEKPVPVGGTPQPAPLSAH